MTARSRLASITLAAVLALGGCDDGDGDATTDTLAADATSDASDAIDDVSTQPDGDTAGDADTAPPASVCGDGEVAADEACDGSAAGATCSGLLGSYGSGATVGAPTCGSACTLDTSACSTLECPAGSSAVAGRCRTDVAPDAYVPEPAIAYVAALDISATAPQPTCCFDLDGDGSIDNALKDLLAGFAATGTGGLDLTVAMNDAVDDGSLSLLVEFQGATLPGDGGEVDVSFFRGVNDLDGDDLPDQDGATRAAGDGVFRLDRASFGPAGARSGVAGTLDTGVAAGADGHLELDVVVPGFFALTIAIEDVRIAFELEDDGDGLRSPVDTIDVNGTAVEVDTAELGGIVRLSELVRVVNDLVDDCSCAGVGPGDVLLEIGTDGVLGCSDLTFEDTACTGDLVAGDGFVCPQLTLLCGATTVLSALPDIDTDGDGVNDALSTGARMRLVPATLDATPVAP